MSSILSIGAIILFVLMNAVDFAEAKKSEVEEKVVYDYRELKR